MGTRRHLGHDAPGGRVERDLARDHVGVDPAPALDEGDARLVARRFHGEDERTGGPRAHPRYWSGGASAGTSSGSMGRASSADRRPPSRSRMAGDSSASVVMISASSPLSE